MDNTYTVDTKMFKGFRADDLTKLICLFWYYHLGQLEQRGIFVSPLKKYEWFKQHCYNHWYLYDWSDKQKTFILSFLKDCNGIEPVPEELTSPEIKALCIQVFDAILAFDDGNIYDSPFDDDVEDFGLTQTEIDANIFRLYGADYPWAEHRNLIVMANAKKAKVVRDYLDGDRQKGLKGGS